jgi:hypothetical protein
MKPFVLSLRYGEQPLRKAVAWFVRGGAPGEWLAEVAGWGVPLADLMLYVVPRSARDLRPLGVLVISPGDARPVVSARAVPYGRISERFYLPVTASLSPPAAESELAGLPASEIEVGVWHPAAGLVGFERGEGRRCSQLLEPPPHVASDWSHARPGVTINQRLRSVLPAESPSAESILDEGRDDIGTQPNDLSQLPELPDEPRPGMLKRLGAAALASAAPRRIISASFIACHTPQIG